MFAGNFAPAGWMPCEGQLLIGKEPTVTRRRFVQAGGAAAAGLYLSGLPAIASAASGPAHLRRSAYSGRVGTTFQAVSVTGATVALRLTGVADLARATQTRSLAGRDDAFALTFTGPPGSLRTCRMDHECPADERLERRDGQFAQIHRRRVYAGVERRAVEAGAARRQSIGRPRNRSRPAAPFERAENPWRS